jgi:hypothetical protein
MIGLDLILRGMVATLEKRLINFNPSHMCPKDKNLY